MQKQNLFVVHGGISYAGFNFEDLPLEAALQVAIQQIDLEADKARLMICGDTLRVMEQQLAEEQARAFLQSTSKESVPQVVKDFAELLGTDAEVAAARLLEQGDEWRDAVRAIHSARLQGRRAVERSNSHTQVEASTDAVLLRIRASTASFVSF